MSLRILHLITINGFGGAEKLLLDLLPGLVDQGAVVECLIYHRPDFPEAATEIGKQLQQSGITVYQRTYNNPLNPRILSEIMKVVRAGKYDCIHSHLKYADVWMALLKKWRRLSIPVVTTLHGYNDAYENKYGLVYNPVVKRTSYYWITRFAYNRLNGYILISRCLNEFYRSADLLWGKRTKIIYHGYHVDNLLQHQAKADVISAPRIAIPGRLLPRKGHRYGIEALEMLHVNYPGASLHIYGNGPHEDELKKLVAEKGLGDSVYFHGYVNDLIQQLNQCDIVLIPSVWEGFGLVFLDAFKAGTPLVAFDLPAGNEIIEDEKSGLLAIPRDAASLAEKMQRIITDPVLRNNLTTEGQNRLVDHFAIGRMTREYIEFYQEIIQAPVVKKKLL